jgi:hypothetical protein
MYCNENKLALANHSQPKRELNQPISGLTWIDTAKKISRTQSGYDTKNQYGKMLCA